MNDLTGNETSFNEDTDLGTSIPRRELEDLQSAHDPREIAIEQVGVSELKYPITVLDKNSEQQQTIANITLSVGLPHDAKGTHMSRFVEVLSDFQITVPEIGTFTAAVRPRVILTSNRTRELNDALKRRCLYLWIDYPSPEREREIILRRVPGIEAAFADSITNVMQALRQVDFYKRPGIAETLDWSQALLGLGATTLSAELIQETAGVILKYHDDIEQLRTLGAGSFI